MGMADCPKCWDANCCCGWEHRTWSLEKLLDFRIRIDAIIGYKAEHPDGKFSQTFGETDDDKAILAHIRQAVKNDEDLPSAGCRIKLNADGSISPSGPQP